jgi:hypothetical protein
LRGCGRELVMRTAAPATASPTPTSSSQSEDNNADATGARSTVANAQSSYDRQSLEEALTDEQGGVRELHASLNRRLKELDRKESRLVDLAADGSMPTAKIRAKLHELKLDRARLEAGLTNTSEELSLGAGVLRDMLDLLVDTQQLYTDANNGVRRHLNQTFFHKFYIDEPDVIYDELNLHFAEVLHAKEAFAAEVYQSQQKSPPKSGVQLHTKTDLPTLSSVFLPRVRVRPFWWS